MRRYHPSHVTRLSWASPTYDAICVNCRATDGPTGPGRLAQPCPREPGPVCASREALRLACHLEDDPHTED